MTEIQVSPGWKELADSINRLKGVVIILGATDAGKTTLAFYLCQELSRGCRVAMISADIGQCAFGPPATLSMSFLEHAPALHYKSTGPVSLVACGATTIKIHSMYFIGSTSPLGHLLQVIVGLKKLVAKAQGGGAEVVVIDTSGFVEGGAAWELKFHKIELTDARHIVALQRRQELEDILSAHENRTCRTLHRLKVYEGIKLKSYEQRRDYRRQKFLEYFQGAKTGNIPLGAVRLINPVNIFLENGSGDLSRTVNPVPLSRTVKVRDLRYGIKVRDLYKRLLVGLSDDENFTLGLGIIEGIEYVGAGLSLRLLTPVEGFKNIKIVRFGDVRLDEDWYDSRAKFTSANPSLRSRTSLPEA